MERSCLYNSIKASVDILRNTTSIHCWSSLDNIMDRVEAYEKLLFNQNQKPSENIETPENIKIN